MTSHTPDKPHMSPEGLRAAIIVAFASILTLIIAMRVLGDPGAPTTVLRVLDGDTLELADGTKVRLEGIDSPEIDQQSGGTALRGLCRLVMGETVVFDRAPVPKTFDRVVGTLYVATDQPGTMVNVNATLALRGHAWYSVSHPGRFAAKLQAAEAKAREKRAGLWKFDHPVPPWDWRKGVRGYRVECQGGTCWLVPIYTNP